MNPPDPPSSKSRTASSASSRHVDHACGPTAKSRLLPRQRRPRRLLQKRRTRRAHAVVDQERDSAPRILTTVTSALNPPVPPLCSTIPPARTGQARARSTLPSIRTTGFCATLIAQPNSSSSGIKQARVPGEISDRRFDAARSPRLRPLQQGPQAPRRSSRPTFLRVVMTICSAISGTATPHPGAAERGQQRNEPSPRGSKVPVTPPLSSSSWTRSACKAADTLIRRTGHATQVGRGQGRRARRSVLLGRAGSSQRPLQFRALLH